MSFETKRVLKKDWVLNAEAFQKLLFSLDTDIEKASTIYEDIRKRLIRQFRANQSQIPEEQADEVFNRIARKIYEEGFILDNSNPFPYFHSMARYILLEYQRESRRKLISLQDLSMSEEPLYNPKEVFAKFTERLRNEAGLNFLEECRRNIGEKDIAILDRYNSTNDEKKKEMRQQLAEDLGKSRNALKIIINRIRKKLLDCARKKLEKIEPAD